MAWFWLVPRSGLEMVSVPFSICGWAAVAVALGWLAQSMRPTPHLRQGYGGQGSQALVALVGVLLIADPGVTRMRLSALGKDRSSEAQARMAYDFRVKDLPPGTAIVAESRRVDAALLLSSQRDGAAALIVPQRIEQVQALTTRGRHIVGFANARSHLERFGFLFERSWMGDGRRSPCWRDRCRAWLSSQASGPTSRCSSPMVRSSCTALRRMRRLAV